jgi:hypothetical protein
MNPHTSDGRGATLGEPRLLGQCRVFCNAKATTDCHPVSHPDERIVHEVQYRRCRDPCAKLPSRVKR